MPDAPFVDSLGAAHVNDEVDDQAGQIEALVEAIGKGAHIALGVLGVVEGLVGARQHRLEVAQDAVDPLELRQVPGLALTPPTSALWVQPASVTAAKHATPSLRTSQPGSKLAFVQLAMASRVKLPLAATFTCIGWPASFADTAATMGILLGDPRPPTPERSPPRQASSSCTSPVNGTSTLRSAIAAISL